MELLVALSIGGIVLACVYMTFHEALRTQARSKDILNTLQWARYTFKHFAGDVRNARPGIAGEIECGGKTCRIPLSGKHGEQIWVQYRFDGQGRLVRELFKGKKTRGTGSRLLSSITVAERLSSADFTMSHSGDGSIKQKIMTLTLSFGECRKIVAHYEKKVLLEQQNDET